MHPVLEHFTRVLTSKVIYMLLVDLMEWKEMTSIVYTLGVVRVHKLKPIIITKITCQSMILKRKIKYRLKYIPITTIIIW